MSQKNKIEEETDENSDDQYDLGIRSPLQIKLIAVGITVLCLLFIGAVLYASNEILSAPLNSPFQ